MHIVWRGQTCFQIQISRRGGEQIFVIIDPLTEETGLKLPKLRADILLMSHYYDSNSIKGVLGSPFLITGPGEYEIKEIFIQGIPPFHDDEKRKEQSINTIYTIEAEGIRICHLGDFDQKELSGRQIDQIGDIDILMIPAGGTIDAKVVAEIISQIEPRIIIPMCYHIPKLKLKLENLDKFLKMMGKKSVEPQSKLLIKKKDLAEEGTKVVVLRP